MNPVPSFPPTVQPTPLASSPVRPPGLPLRSWLAEGLRAGFLLPPRVAGHTPAPRQVAALLVIYMVLETLLARFEVAGPARFDLHGWLAPWWSSGLVLLLAWWALPAETPASSTRPAGLSAWFALWMGGAMPASVVSQLLGVAQVHGALPEALLDSAWASWGLYFALWAWTIAALLRLFRHFGVGGRRLAAAALGLVVLFATSAWHFPDRPWQAEVPEVSQSVPSLQLSQELFETQQALWRRQVDGIAAQRPGVLDVYGLVFSPFAEEDVFLREGALVSGVLAERFDAQDRVLHLANHAATAQSLAWATPVNLERAIEAMAARMDLEHDLLVLYLTSHGAQDFRLAASNGPLAVEPLSPGDLRRALDKAGIRNRVVMVSACYSGGWVGPLASDSTLVMTAADADHTSYGCGRLSALTFFGRALFDEQLRRTRSFEQAFAAAVPVIRQREIDAGKDDGFSNPQISVGEKIRPVLRELELRLETKVKPPG